MNPNEDAAALYDEFLACLQQPNADVAAWIEAAAPPDLRETQLDTLKVWLDNFRPLPREVVEELRHFYTVQLTFHSNALEGNTLSQSETELVLSHGVTVGGHSLVEHLEVIGHRDAMGFMEELSRDGTPITAREIKDLHALILRPTEGASGQNEAGRFRFLDVRAAGTDHLYPPHYRVQELMDEFVAWLRSDEAKRLHPVVLASEAHFRFVSIHPFRDGNGRTARLLMNLLLLRAGFPVAVISSARRAQYIEALVRGQQHGDDAAPLTELVAEACGASLVETLRLLSTSPTSRGQNGDFYRALLNTPH